MGIPSVFRDLIDAGVTFETDGERLRWRNSGGRITPDVVAILRHHKAEIVSYLEVAPQPAEVAPFPTPEPSQPSRPAPSRPEPDAFPYGHSVDGQPLTWTGKVVSLAEWKRLSEWDKHGSTGKVWNGITRAWEPMDGATA